MNTSHGSQKWERTDLHPELPGRNLGAFGLAGGDEVCLYDDDNPEAYIVGDGVEIGTSK